MININPIYLEEGFGSFIRNTSLAAFLLGSGAVGGKAIKDSISKNPKQAISYVIPKVNIGIKDFLTRSIQRKFAYLTQCENPEEIKILLSKIDPKELKSLRSLLAGYGMNPKVQRVQTVISQLK